MKINKDYYSSLPYEIWIKNVGTDFKGALESLELELLCKATIDIRNCLRILYCALRINDSTILEDYFNLLESVIGDDMYFIVNYSNYLLTLKGNNDEVLKYLISIIPKVGIADRERLIKHCFKILCEIKNVDYFIKFLETCIDNYRDIIFKINPNRIDLNFYICAANNFMTTNENNEVYKYLLLQISNILNSSDSLNPILDYKKNDKLEIIDLVNRHRFYDAYKVISKIDAKSIAKDNDLSIAYITLLTKLSFFKLLDDYYITYLKGKNCGTQLRLTLIQAFYKSKSDLNASSLLEIAYPLYEYAYRNNTSLSCNDIFIFISWNSTFACQKTNINGNIIYIADTSVLWYIMYPEFYINDILKRIVTPSQKILVTGNSKGAFGALLLAYLLRKKCNNEIYVLAFSPQTRLYPFNENLVNVSKAYLNLYQNASKYSIIEYFLRKYGDLFKFYNEYNNIHTFVYYAANNYADTNEAMYLNSSNTIYLARVPELRTHDVMTYFYLPKDVIIKKIKTQPAYNGILNLKKKYNFSFDDVIDATFNLRTLF